VLALPIQTTPTPAYNASHALQPIVIIVDNVVGIVCHELPMGFLLMHGAGAFSSKQH
jgi:hypothetical protein